MNIDITAAVALAADQAVHSADINRFIGRFTNEFQKAIDAEYERILLDGIRVGTGWIWKHLSKVIADSIYIAVYNQYYNNLTGEPNMYKRRYADGGLADPENIRLSIVNGEIVAENIATARNHKIKLEKIILEGRPYDYEEGENTTGTFKTPRNFYYTAQRRYDAAMINGRLNELLNARAQDIANDVLRRIS